MGIAKLGSGFTPVDKGSFDDLSGSAKKAFSLTQIPNLPDHLSSSGLKGIEQASKSVLSAYTNKQIADRIKAEKEREQKRLLMESLQKELQKSNSQKQTTPGKSTKNNPFTPPSAPKASQGGSGSQGGGSQGAGNSQQGGGSGCGESKNDGSKGAGQVSPDTDESKNNDAFAPSIDRFTPVDSPKGGAADMANKMKTDGANPSKSLDPIVPVNSGASKSPEAANAEDTTGAKTGPDASTQPTTVSSQQPQTFVPFTDPGGHTMFVPLEQLKSLNQATGHPNPQDDSSGSKGATGPTGETGQTGDKSASLNAAAQNATMQATAGATQATNQMAGAKGGLQDASKTNNQLAQQEQQQQQQQAQMQQQQQMQQQEQQQMASSGGDCGGLC